MDEQQIGRQRSGSAANTTFQAPLYSSMSTSASQLASSSMVATGMTPSETPNRLRNLPGYSQSPDFLTSRMNNNQAGISATQQRSSPMAAAPSPVASKPYQSRERVYYQQPAPAITSKPSSTSTSMTQSSTTNPFKPLSEAEMKADVPPPAGSLYDDPLSPERRPMDNSRAAAVLSSPKGKEIDYLSGIVASSPNRIITGSSLADFQPASINVESTDPIDCWVTVFGFTGAQASAVLAYFKILGHVVKTELGQRNWLHIQYESPWAAQKALLKNGTVLPSAGSSMIGVLPTKQAMDQVGLASTSFLSPLKKKKETPIAQSPFATMTALPSSNLRISTDATAAVPQTPGFPQTTMYSSSLGSQAGPFPTQTEQPKSAPVPSIFAAEAAREQASMAATEAAANGPEGLVTKAFNYIFGF